MIDALDAGASDEVAAPPVADENEGEDVFEDPEQAAQVTASDLSGGDAQDESDYVSYVPQQPHMARSDSNASAGSRGSSSSQSSQPPADQLAEADPDLAEAIRLSLLDRS